MNPRSRLRNARYRRSASLRLFLRVAADLAASARSSSAEISAFSAHPLGEPRAVHHRLHDQHDLVAVGVVRTELGALAGIEPALEQRAENRRVDL